MQRGPAVQPPTSAAVLHLHANAIGFSAANDLVAHGRIAAVVQAVDQRLPALAQAANRDR